MKEYEYRHIVGFEETNLVGNVYYANFVSWQGRCREMFLREYVPEVLEMFKEGFALITTRVSCEFINELSAFDEIVIRMRLGAIKQNRILMLFEYWRVEIKNEELIARGEQEVACVKRENEGIVPISVPDNFRSVLQSFAEN